MTVMLVSQTTALSGGMIINVMKSKACSRNTGNVTA